MFNVRVGKYNIQFTFKHSREVDVVIHHRVVTDVTDCILKINGQEFTGVSACVHPDMFVKEIGRRQSLKRALEAARKKIELPHEVRQAIWIRYDERHVSNMTWYWNDIAAGILDAEYDPPKINPVS